MIIKKNIKHHLKRISFLLWVCYILLLIYLLFLSPHYGRNNNLIERDYNLIPFRMIHNYLKYGSNYQKIVNIYGNIVAFLPMGFFIPIVAPLNRSVIKITSISAFVSIGVEILQYRLNVGSFDVDDIILNTFGGIVGYVFFLVSYGMYVLFVKYNKNHHD